MTSLSNSPKALVLQDECFGKNYSSILDFTRNYERTSGIFVPCIMALLYRIVICKDICEMLANDNAFHVYNLRRS